MGFLIIEDNTGEIDAVVFSKEYAILKDQLYEDNILGFSGHRSFDNRSFVIKNLIDIWT